MATKKYPTEEELIEAQSMGVTQPVQPIDPERMDYENPVTKYHKPLDGGGTYSAYSFIPEDQMVDPSVEMPADINPVDWRNKESLSNPERDQRRMIRDYIENKYNKAADTGGVQRAEGKAQMSNLLGDVGYGLESMFKSRSVGQGGPQVDKDFYQGIKRSGEQGVQRADAERRAKIEDYLMRQKMGSEGVMEHAKMKELDQAGLMRSPDSDISRAYQKSLAQTYGDKLDGMDVSTMSANDIMSFAKMMEGRARLDLDAEVKRAQLGLGERALDQKSAPEMASPKVQAEIDKLKADTEYTKKRTEYVGKPGASSGSGKVTATGKPISEGQRHVDRDYAKDYNEWTSKGVSDFSSNIERLEEAKNYMKALKDKGRGSKVSGTTQSVMGKLSGDIARSNESLAVERDVKKAVVGSLKALFGGNPTEGEREAAVRNDFDVRLPIEKNINMLESTIKELRERARVNQDKARHWEQSKGTLEGFKSKSVTGLVNIQSKDGTETRLVPEEKVPYYLEKGGRVVP